MSGPIAMDLENKIFALGFDDQDKATKYLKEQTDSGVFTEQQIQFKSNPIGIGPTMLRPIYVKIFGKAKNVYFKDYVTNAIIVTLPKTDQYWATFTSLMEYLDYPRFLIIYKIA